MLYLPKKRVAYVIFCSDESPEGERLIKRFSRCSSRRLRHRPRSLDAGYTMLSVNPKTSSEHASRYNCRLSGGNCTPLIIDVCTFCSARHFGLFFLTGGLYVSWAAAVFVLLLLLLPTMLRQHRALLLLILLLKDKKCGVFGLEKGVIKAKSWGQ